MRYFTTSHIGTFFFLRLPHALILPECCHKVALRCAVSMMLSNLQSELAPHREHGQFSTVRVFCYFRLLTDSLSHLLQPPQCDQ